MKSTSIRRFTLPAAALALGLGLTACGAANEEPANSAESGASATEGLSGTLNGAGSSAQAAAEQAWQAGFQTKHSGVTVNYDPVGSGGGREQFLSGGVQFAGSDAYLTDEELAASKKVCGGQEAFDIPVYVSPIAVVYNLDGVNDLQVSPQTVAAIFDGKITKWNDPKLKAENPDAQLPSSTINPVHRSDDSGTTDNFTDYLNKASDGVWGYEPDGVWPNKVGEAAPQNSGVAAAVRNGSGTIGYVDESQAGDLSIAAVKVGSGYEKPTPEAAAKAIDTATTVSGRSAGDFALEIDRATSVQGAYPIALLSYAIACPTYDDQNTVDLVKAYLSYIISAEGQKAAAETAGSAPLSQALSDKATEQIASISLKG